MPGGQDHTGDFGGREGLLHDEQLLGPIISWLWTIRGSGMLIQDDGSKGGEQCCHRGPRSGQKVDNPGTKTASVNRTGGKDHGSILTLASPMMMVAGVDESIMSVTWREEVSPEGGERGCLAESGWTRCHHRPIHNKRTAFFQGSPMSSSHISPDSGLFLFSFLLVYPCLL